MSSSKREETELQFSDKFKNMNMYDYYLTPKEQQLITYLNKNTTKIDKAKEDHDRLENLSIKTIYKRWSDRIYQILNDLIEEFQKLMNIQPSDSLDTNKNELEKYRKFFINVIKIRKFIKNF